MTSFALQPIPLSEEMRSFVCTIGDIHFEATLKKKKEKAFNT